MQDTVLTAAIITVFIALIWFYETKTVRLELQLDSALDELEKRSDLNHEPPFNLITEDPVFADAYRLHAAEQRTFSQAEIDGWN